MLNQDLYDKLVARFGADDVLIVNQGFKGEFQFGEREVIVGQQIRSYKTLRKVYDGAFVGEEFRVCCPFCMDSRHRLYINHQWGVYYKKINSRNLWLINCYNEGCMRDYQKRMQFYNSLVHDQEMHLDTRAAKQRPKNQVVSWPGEMLRLSHLAKVEPSNPVLHYLLSRGLCPIKLENLYDVRFCKQAFWDGSDVTGRLVVPVYRGEKMVTWSARKIREDAPGPKWRHAKAPTAGVIYGLKQAVKHSVVVPVEGPGDRWSVGPCSFATLGKVIGQRAVRIAAAVNRHDVRAIPVLYDPEMSEDAIRHGRKHHIERAVDDLQPLVDCPVFGVYLPEGTDPGGLEGDYVWWHINQELRKRGLRHLVRRES